ncbi:MAG: imidazoleglycerol-phosphate dehydratase HisB [Oscillospiraceae bacterium]|jgi:imidazoleglycerol-phosphate dehydratase|nr:imidazoleglycerol-phosphate dehydratase HisB [Oscillospiraceae bacterium]
MKTTEITRKTKETEITLNLSENPNSVISTGIGFFDHMLTALFFYSKIGAELRIRGDLSVDAHHSVEDAGIVIGQALAQALGDKRGIKRFSHAYIPMDEALGFCAIDVSGRAFLAFDAEFPQEKIGEYDSCLTEEFFRALSNHAGITLHLRVSGFNAHHMTEALFKAFGVALGDAVKITGDGVNSTKGVL